jgi:hypothetical protein
MFDVAGLQKSSKFSGPGRGEEGRTLSVLTRERETFSGKTPLKVDMESET